MTEWLTCPLWEREIEGSNPSVLSLWFSSEYEKVAEWLRRQTVNLLEVSVTGSNPVLLKFAPFI